MAVWAYVSQCIKHSSRQGRAALDVALVTRLCRITMSVTYNSYGTTRKSKTRNWEGRMKCLSGLMGCSEAMTGAQKSHDQDRNDKP